MPRCECSAKADEVAVKERLTARKVQQPDFPGGIEEIQVLFRGDSSDERMLSESAGEAVFAIVIAKQVQRPVSFDVERHTMPI
jgi:hypothetical protein